MAIYSRLTYPHLFRYVGEGQARRKSQFQNASCLSGDIIAYQIMNQGKCFFVRPPFSLIFLIVEEIAGCYALMNLAITQMVETSVPYRCQEIACVGRGVVSLFEQLCKHIVYHVARDIIIVHKCRRHTVHLRIMSLEKLLYVIPVSHILSRHTASVKLNLEKEEILKKDTRAQAGGEGHWKQKIL